MLGSLKVRSGLEQGTGLYAVQQRLETQQRAAKHAGSCVFMLQWCIVASVSSVVLMGKLIGFVHEKASSSIVRDPKKTRLMSPCRLMGSLLPVKRLK
jgi:hypothetical protein